jgi:hypothetical protein
MTVIDFLCEADRETLGYKAVQKQFNGHEHIPVVNGQMITNRLRQGNFEENKLIILAHGGQTGIASSPANGQTISYTEILNSLNDIVNDVPFELNLAAICNSVVIERYHNLFPAVLRVIWCTENETSSIDAAFIINTYKDNGIDMLKDKGKYKKIKNHN